MRIIKTELTLMILSCNNQFKINRQTYQIKFSLKAMSTVKIIYLLLCQTSNLNKII